MIRGEKIVVLVLCVMFLAALWSCQTPAGRTAGVVIDDASITTQVKAKLLHDKILTGLAISVSTFEGEVTLIGAVKTLGIKQHASRVAGSVAGVRSVKNLLRIR
ncbi:MAG: BON domain-containing protein [Thermodesulfobacteriota bacterium]|nr:BON domain-containing protein [Thermodesulfobacteriota bacterium]